MSRFKFFNNIGGSSESIPKSTIIVNSSEKGTIVIKSTGIKSYDRDLIVKKINLISDYIKEDHNISIDHDKVENIIKVTK